MRRPILNNSVRGDIIYDPFLGSGTTLVAAHSTDRICYGLDVHPRYIDLVIQRWQKITSQVAVLASDGRSFDQVRAERAVVEVA
jgi:DNA modification methylase